MAGTKGVGGGRDPMHLTNTKHPFEIGKNDRGAKATSKFAHTVGVGAPPGGEGNMISANSAMKKHDGSINGPGIAK